MYPKQEIGTNITEKTSLLTYMWWTTFTLHADFVLIFQKQKYLKYRIVS